MCDTIAILSDRTADGSILFAKNSDREPNEAQAIVAIPAQRWSSNTLLACTYISIPQASQTYAVVLSKPFHMWGAEMGVNEHGLVIGNEAVFTKVAFSKCNDGLTGMDLLRLALERCRTAQAAVHTITTLLQAYGQDSCSGYKNLNFYYHNSFLIADRQEVWLLETVDRYWAARRFERGIVTISNGLTIGTEFDLIAPGTQAFAQKQGWWRPARPFHFAQVFSDRFYTHMSSCRTRQQLTTSTMDRHGIEPLQLMHLLRQHNLPQMSFTPARANTTSICMHATGPWNPSSTTSSMIVAIPPQGRPHIWLTGTSYPCTSAFKPFRIDDPLLLPQHRWNQPTALPDASLWWQNELMSRALAPYYREFRPQLRAQLDEIECSALSFAWDAPASSQVAQSEQLLDQHFQLIAQWQAKLGSLPKSAIWKTPVYALSQWWYQRQLKS